MDIVNVDSARLAWDVAQTVIMAVIGIYVWWTGRTRATTRAIGDVDDRVTKLDHDVRQLSQTVDSRPGHGDVDALRAEITTTNRSLAEVSAQLQGTTALLNRLHEYLLQERGNK